MGTNRTIKVSALIEVNSHILEVAAESPSRESDQEFFCECGDPNCHEHVMLTVEAFLELRADDLPVLAPGHQLSPVERSTMLRQDASALLAHAQHQTKRAHNTEHPGASRQTP